MPNKPQPLEVLQRRVEARLGDRFPLLGLVADVSIARAVGMSRERVRQYRVLFGIPCPPRSLRPMLDSEAEVVAAWNAGRSTGWVAQEYEIPVAKVQGTLAMAVRRGIRVRERTTERSTHTLHRGVPLRWTPDAIREVEVWWARGDALPDIASRMGMATASLRCWLSTQRKRGYDFPYRGGNVLFRSPQGP